MVTLQPTWSHFMAINDHTMFKVEKQQLHLCWDQKIHKPRGYKAM